MNVSWNTHGNIVTEVKADVNLFGLMNHSTVDRGDDILEDYDINKDIIAVQSFESPGLNDLRINV